MKLRCAKSCALISFSLWEEASAAGTELVMSDFAAPQLWLPFPTALETQVGISFEAKPDASEHSDLMGFIFSVLHS